jgi:hypothetical protein
MIDTDKCIASAAGAACKGWQGEGSIPKCVADCKKTKTKTQISGAATDNKRTGAVNALSTANYSKIKR